MQLLKTLPQMLFQTAKKLEQDIEYSFMIGERMDIQAGQVGCQTSLLNTNPFSHNMDAPHNYVADNWSEVVEYGINCIQED